MSFHPVCWWCYGILSALPPIVLERASDTVYFFFSLITLTQFRLKEVGKLTLRSDYAYGEEGNDELLIQPDAEVVAEVNI